MPAMPPHRVIFYIMLAVFAWGAMLALGAFLYGGTRQALKADIILGCVALFLGLWALLLRARARRAEKKSLGAPPRKQQDDAEPT